SCSVAQEWCESCYFLSKRFQSSLLDCVGCAFGDDEGALPVVLAIEQDENFAPVDMAKGLPRISGTAAYPHPHHIHRSAEMYSGRAGLGLNPGPKSIHTINTFDQISGRNVSVA